jgi:hypothetical protein
MHLAQRGYLLIVLMALLGIAGTWSDDPAFESAWLLPAFLLLAGLAVEAWYLRGTQVSVRMRLEPRLKLGRPSRGAFAFEHNRGLGLRLQYARRCRRRCASSTKCASCRCPRARWWATNSPCCRCASARQASARCRRGC